MPHNSRLRSILVSAILLAAVIGLVPAAADADEIGANAQVVVSADGGLRFLGGRFFGPPQMSDDARYLVYREEIQDPELRWLDRASDEAGVVVLASDGIPQISGDGQWVVVVDHAARSVGVWGATDRTLRSLELLTEEGAIFSEAPPDISDDGRRVLWTAARNFGRSDWAVRLWDRETGEIERYAGAGGVFLDGGSRFAYSPAGGSGRVVVDIETGATSDLDSFGILSDDGDVAAFGTFQPKGVTYSTASTGATNSVLLEGDTQLNAPIPIVSGDGSHVFFSTNSTLVPEDTDGGFSSYRVDVDTGELAVVIDPVTGTLVDVTPDGRQGLFIDRDEIGSGYDLVVADLRPPPPSVPIAAQQAPQLSDQVGRLYRAFFLRSADAGGLAFWNERRASGQSLSQIAEQFAQSPEFVDRYGSLSGEEFVDLIYQNVQGRAGEPEGRAFWIGQLAAGVSRGQVMVGFSESAEFVSTTGTSTATDPVAASVWRLYRAYYLRDADQGGFDFWYQQVLGGRTLREVSDAFSEAPEFVVLYGELTDDEFIEQIYSNVLDRAPDEAGSRFWRDQMAGGASRGEVMLSFSESAEFIATTDTLPPF